MLMSLETEDKEDFETYGDLTYVMNLDVRNIDVWVGVTVQTMLSANGVTTAGRSGTEPQIQFSWSLWNGGAKQLDPREHWLKVTEKTGYSCSGCTAAGQALDPTANTDKCGVPLKCKSCEP
jgi:hypothetical protein